MRAKRGNELIEDLEKGTSDHEQDEERDGAASSNGQRPMSEGFRQWISVQHVVDDDLQRPRLQRAEHDLEEEQDNQDDDASAVGPKKRQGPGQQRARRAGPAAAFGHPVTFLGSTAGKDGFARTRFGAIFGMFNATTRSLLESAT